MVFNIRTISSRVADELIVKACLKETDGAFSCVSLRSRAVCLPFPAGPSMLVVKRAVASHHFITLPSSGLTGAGEGGGDSGVSNPARKSASEVCMNPVCTWETPVHSLPRGIRSENLKKKCILL